MANAIAFKPKTVDPKLELQRRLAEAPKQHAEALLVAYDLLEEAHKQGILDALHGAIGARDTIAGLIAKYSAEEVSVNAIRNSLALARIVGTMNPETVSTMSKEMFTAMETHAKEAEPPTLWQLFKRVRQPDTRRGISLALLMLSAAGRSARQ